MHQHCLLDADHYYARMQLFTVWGHALTSWGQKKYDVFTTIYHHHHHRCNLKQQHLSVVFKCFIQPLHHWCQIGVSLNSLGYTRQVSVELTNVLPSLGQFGSYHMACAQKDWILGRCLKRKLDWYLTVTKSCSHFGNDKLQYTDLVNHHILQNDMKTKL